VQTTGSPALITTITTVSAPGSDTAGTAIAASAISATLAGQTSDATGTITFTVFGPTSPDSPPTNCTTGGTTVGTATVSGNTITYNPSGSGFTPPSAGTYWWYASYGGAAGKLPVHQRLRRGHDPHPGHRAARRPVAHQQRCAEPGGQRGQLLTYTLQAANPGGQDATGVKVTDPLPASAVFGSVSASQGACTRTVSDPNRNKDGTVTCTLGTLPADATATVTITVTPTKPGTLESPGPPP